ncbi:MAG TPA: hypothetical protein VES97_08000 [Solirubrobacteraceae bacterium]|nr:hypothetical protein [Solirubrobacteraceae bacterium]
MSGPAKSPTTDADLRVLVKLLTELPGLTPARLEFSIEDGIVTAQVMADKIAMPLAGQGADAPAALRALVETVEQAVKGRPRRRRGKPAGR